MADEQFRNCIAHRIFLAKTMQRDIATSSGYGHNPQHPRETKEPGVMTHIFKRALSLIVIAIGIASLVIGVAAQQTSSAPQAPTAAAGRFVRVPIQGPIPTNVR